MEGFCLPLGVPDCEMCKMVPPFLEARTEAALGLELCGALCPCSRQRVDTTGQWMMTKAEG